MRTLLAAHAGRFAHLTSIDLDSNFLSPRGGQKLLGKLCPEVRFGRQQPPDDLFEWD